MSDQLVSVADAAKLVGRNRQTLYRDYLKTGKLSATNDEATGKKLIAISELIRVFGSVKLETQDNDTVSETVSTLQLDTHSATAELQAKLAALQAENAGLRDRLADKDAHIDDLRTTVRLLEYKPQSDKSHKSGAWWEFWRK